MHIAVILCGFYLTDVQYVMKDLEHKAMCRKLEPFAWVLSTKVSDK